MYINKVTLEQHTERDIRTLHPNTSFQVPFQAPAEYALIFPAPQPAYDPITQIVVQQTPVLTDKVHYQQSWQIVELDSDAIAANQAAKVLADRQAAKQARTTAVEAITVTTAAGNTFDGDEIAQGRVARAIIVLSTGAAPSVPWVLADNTVIQATAAELTEALALAGAAQAELWII